MKMTEGRVRSHNVSSSFDMIALVCTSRAPNGSSISRIDGSLISDAASLAELISQVERQEGLGSMPPDR